MEKMKGTIGVVFAKLSANSKAKSYSLRLKLEESDIWFGLGFSPTNKFEVNGKVLEKGFVVEFEYDPAKYNNVNHDSIKIISSELPKEVKKEKVDKDLPIRLGNACTIATHLTKSKSDIVTVAKQVMPMVDELREKLTAKHQELDSYSLGARLGQTAIIAAQYTANINEFIEFAEQLFEEICEAEKELKHPEVKEPVKKEKQVKTEKIVVEDKKETVETVVDSVALNSEPPMDFDDDIPF